MMWNGHVRRAVVRVLVDSVRLIDTLIASQRPNEDMTGSGHATEPTSSSATPPASSADKEPVWQTTGHGAVENWSQTQILRVQMLGYIFDPSVCVVILNKPTSSNLRDRWQHQQLLIEYMNYLYPSPVALLS